MKSTELPLVVFTVLSQTAIGMAVLGALRSFSGLGGYITATEWTCIAALMFVGIVASTLHLGHPLRAAGALNHLLQAWLSREILFAGLFLTVALVAALVTSLSGVPEGNALFTWLGAVFAIGLLVTAAMTYAPPAMPAIHNGIPMLLFSSTALLLGAALAALCTEGMALTFSVTVFAVMLWLYMALHLYIPFSWLQGNAVVRSTGKAWLASYFYKGHMLCVALAWAVFAVQQEVSVLLLLLLMGGALIGRAGFFADTVHASEHIGKMY